MNKQYLIATISLVLLFSCNNQQKTKMLDGWWKLQKVEVSLNNTCLKTIETAGQSWRFYEDSVVIFELQQKQKVLFIHIGDHVIKTVDSDHHHDELFINQLNLQCMELTSTQLLNKREFKVMYHLQKMK